ALGLAHGGIFAGCLYLAMRRLIGKTDKKSKKRRWDHPLPRKMAVMPSSLGGSSKSLRNRRFHFSARHNQRACRKAKNWSGGRYRPGRPRNGAVLARAFLFSSTSAWRYILRGIHGFMSEPHRDYRAVHTVAGVGRETAPISREEGFARPTSRPEPGRRVTSSMDPLSPPQGAEELSRRAEIWRRKMASSWSRISRTVMNANTVFRPECEGQKIRLPHHRRVPPPDRCYPCCDPMSCW